MITKEYLQQELAKRIKGYKPGVETTTDNMIAEMKSILVLVDALPDYEKKYNEALARAKDVKNGPSPHDSSVATVEYIFPELRESEDERIRKGLIKLLTVASEAYLVESTSIKKDSYLAYLEKQKEQKPAEWSEEDKNMWAHLNGYLNGFSCSENAIKQMADWFYELPNRFNLQPWKPSEDQMDALKELIEDANRDGWVTPGATELYENLKRL